MDLNDNIIPTTLFTYYTFSCFNCNFDDIIHALDSEYATNDKWKMQQKPFAFDLYEGESRPGGAHFPKAYFYVPKVSSCCVMFSNYADGLATMTYWMSRKVQCQCYNFRITNADTHCSINSLEYISCGKLLRIVYAMQDPQWVFYNKGDTLWFEDEALYANRQVKHRLNSTILTKYCLKLDFDITNPNFWKSKKSVLLERIKW